MIQNVKKLGVKSVLFTFLIKLSSFLRVSFIIGSYAGFFSAVNVITPLVGVFGGVNTSFGVFALGLIMRSLLYGFDSFHYLAYHIPGLFASLYWGTGSALIRVGVPVACMLLFLFHPVGGAAAPYALFWLIPIILYGYGRKNLFFQALGSTFVAHAVGSVIWLYAVPMTATMWLALIPVVVVERLLFAAAMVVVHRGLSRSLNMLERYCTPVLHLYGIEYLR